MSFATAKSGQDMLFFLGNGDFFDLKMLDTFTPHADGEVNDKADELQRLGVPDKSDGCLGMPCSLDRSC